MAAKKFYAVKKGKMTGLFYSWDDCKQAVEGYPNAEYKGFASHSEALNYLGVTGGPVSAPKVENVFPPLSGGPGLSNSPNGGLGVFAMAQAAAQATLEAALAEDKQTGTDSAGRKAPVDYPAQGVLRAYVDGSYDDGLKKYAFGCVFLLPEKKIYRIFGNGDNPQSLQHRNVTGEMLGAMYAVKTAMMNGYRAIEIYYDYEGIEKWVSGAWKSRTDLTGKYAAAMREWGASIKITFHKVPAHSNVRFNELADETAKRGITEGNGVPKVYRFEDMEPVEE